MSMLEVESTVAICLENQKPNMTTQQQWMKSFAVVMAAIDHKKKLQAEFYDLDSKLETVVMVRKRRVNKGEPEKPWMPTTIVPQSLGRKVLLKIGNRFLRVGNDVKPAISKVKPPLTPPSGVCKWDLLSDRRGPGPPKRPKPHPGYFNFRDFTFLVDETASDTASWFRSMRSYFHVRIGVQREGASGPTEFLSPVERDLPRVQYDRTADRCWWRVTAVGRGRFLVQSVQPEGLTLMDGPFGLTLGPALTAQEWAGVTKGRLNTARTLSIIPLSDFVHGGVTVN